MKVFVSHPSNLDNIKDVLSIIKNVLAQKNYDVILPHEGSLKNTKEIIKEADMVIADVSIPSFGSGVEVGWADSFSKKMLFLAKKGAKPSSSTKLLSNDFIIYDSLQDLKEKLQKRFK